MDWNKVLFEIVFSLITFILSYSGIAQSQSVTAPTPKIQILLPTSVTLVLGVNSTKAFVTKVIDGDTIEIEGGKRVRLIGIDAPEKMGIECYSQESAKYLENLILRQTISLEKDVSETDRYGRLLRYVYLENVLVNKKLVEDGYAFAASYPPDIKYQDILKVAENDARKSSNGLWRLCI